MFTDKKRKYAEARHSGLNMNQSALAAGCPPKTARQAATRLEKDPDVIAHLGRLKVGKSHLAPAADAAATSMRPSSAEEKKFSRQKPLSDDIPEAFIAAPANDPKEFLEGVMNAVEADPKLRVDAAKTLMMYTHVKAGEGGKKDEVAEAAKKASRGKFGQTKPPSPLRAVN